MFHLESSKVKDLILQGKIGLEKESLRIDTMGRMAQTAHPFSVEDERVTRDFCENQTEINTLAYPSAHETVAALDEHNRCVQRALAARPEREYLWPFSNPPYIRDEEDIPVARFDGIRSNKTEYRRYLEERYGKYKMAYCGIHFNFSFGEELLEKDFRVGGGWNFPDYKNRLYLDLAQKVTAYGWLLTALTAASPVLDGSFLTKGLKGEDAFLGLASPRCSEIGYWNHFTPIFDYSSVDAYAASIEKYVLDGFLRAPTELYYPVRLKPRGLNNLDALRKKGVDHIELRMFDLNPLCREGIDARDVVFTHLFLAFLAATPRITLNPLAQVRSVQNFKNAAKYDLNLVRILLPNDSPYSLLDAGRTILQRMKTFFKDAGKEILDVLDFEEEKIANPWKRYAHEVRRLYSGTFLQKGLTLAKRRQEEYL